MPEITELERLAETDGATFIRTATGAWWARDRDGVTIVRGALSRAEATRIYCEEKDLCGSSPEAILAYIIARYRPYDEMPAFAEGFAALAARQYRNPYPSSVEAQAWDRGLEAAARYARALACLEAGRDDPAVIAPGWLSNLMRRGGC